VILIFKLYVAQICEASCDKKVHMSFSTYLIIYIACLKMPRADQNLHFKRNYSPLKIVGTWQLVNETQLLLEIFLFGNA